MFTEDDLLPISGLQHLAFCPRQCALIHLENIWDENRLTAEGRNIHDKTHEAHSEWSADLRIARSLRLHSFKLGLVGQADVVEFHPSDQGVVLPGADGRWRPYPVEYKRGRPKFNHCDIVQLCAQAICLEEMLGITINEGALFYYRPRRRQEIDFTEELRKETTALAFQLHEFIKAGNTPVARYEKKCKSCSLLDICMPKVTGVKKNVALYLAKAQIEVLEDETPS
jgi:CRISPR-associated exonuclease Cas4